MLKKKKKKKVQIYIFFCVVLISKPTVLAILRIYWLHSQQGWPGYDKLHLMVRLRFWISGECGLTLWLPLLPGPLWLRMVEKYSYSLGILDATIVEGNLTAPFSLATKMRGRRGRNSFLWIAPLYPWYVPYNAEC